MVDRKAIMEETINRIKNMMPDETIDKYPNMKMDVDTISTGSLAVDAALGGGFAKGRLVELVGFTSSGKTTLALTCIANIQKENPEANILYIDAENALDPSYARKLGVNVDELYVIQPNNGENGYEAATQFISSGVADLVVIDSIAAMVPKALLDVELGTQAQIGVGARLDSQAIAKIFNIANKTGTTVLLINQLKERVSTNPYARGDALLGSLYQSGGASLPFFLTQMLEIRKVDTLYENNEAVSNHIRVLVRKNKIAPPYREADFFITFAKGLDEHQESIDLGVSLGLISKAGSFYKIPEYELSIQGRQKLANWFAENEDKHQELRDKMKNILQGKDIENITYDISN